MNTKDKGTNTKQSQSNQSNFSTQFPESKREKLIQTCSNTYLSNNVNYDPMRLAKFITKASDLILNELDNDCLSQVFTIWNGCFDQCGLNNSKKITAQRLSDINSRHIRSISQKSKGDNNRCTITQLDWNSSGSILVVVYGNGDHMALSKNPGLIELWEIQTDYQQASCKPIASLTYDCELTCIAAHPQNPYVFAAGSQTGEIVIFRNADDNILSVYAVSNVGVYFHESAVLNLAWYYDETKESEWILYSTGQDCKILTWSLSNKLKYPTNGYYLVTPTNEAMPKTETNKSYIMGTTISIFCHNDKTTFVIGSDCGEILVARDDSASLKKNIESFRLSMKWTSSAKEILKRIEDSSIDNVVKKAEGYSKERGKGGVDRNVLYAIGISPTLMYPPLDCCNFTCPHVGNLNSVDFCDGRLLSCGDDGVVQLFRINDHSQLQMTHIIETSVPSQTVIAAFGSSDVSFVELFEPLSIFD